MLLQAVEARRQIAEQLADGGAFELDDVKLVRVGPQWCWYVNFDRHRSFPLRTSCGPRATATSASRLAFRSPPTQSRTKKMAMHDQGHTATAVQGDRDVSDKTPATRNHFQRR